VEVTIYTLRNGVVRVEDAENNLYAAIDLVRGVGPAGDCGGLWGGVVAGRVFGPRDSSLVRAPGFPGCGNALACLGGNARS
jgi:hypothetical protein